MEDWEQFFDEKSRRRADKERRRRRRRFLRVSGLVLFTVVMMIGVLMLLIRR